MAVEWLRAHCRCDRCMAAFDVEVDTASEITTLTPSVFEVIVDAVRSGGGMGGAPTSVVKDDDGENELLCGACTAIEEAKINV